jgi:hypothetical protein
VEDMIMSELYDQTLKRLCKSSKEKLQESLKNGIPVERFSSGEEIIVKKILKETVKILSTSSSSSEKKKEKIRTIYRLFITFQGKIPSDFDENLPKVGWILDESCSYCLECFTKFGLMKWKHHCRSCGDLICQSCCFKGKKSNKLSSSRSYEKLKSSSSSRLSLSSPSAPVTSSATTTGSKEKEEKDSILVCKSCFQQYYGGFSPSAGSKTSLSPLSSPSALPSSSSWIQFSENSNDIFDSKYAGISLSFLEEWFESLREEIQVENLSNKSGFASSSSTSMTTRFVDVYTLTTTDIWNFYLLPKLKEDYERSSFRSSSANTVIRTASSTSSFFSSRSRSRSRSKSPVPGSSSPFFPPSLPSSTSAVSSVRSFCQLLYKEYSTSPRKNTKTRRMIGMANYYLSCDWNLPFYQMLAILKERFGKRKEETLSARKEKEKEERETEVFLWIDIFSLSPNDIEGENDPTDAGEEEEEDEDEVVTVLNEGEIEREMDKEKGRKSFRSTVSFSKIRKSMISLYDNNHNNNNTVSALQLRKDIIQKIGSTCCILSSPCSALPDITAVKTSFTGSSGGFSPHTLFLPLSSLSYQYDLYCSLTSSSSCQVEVLLSSEEAEKCLSSLYRSEGGISFFSSFFLALEDVISSAFHLHSSSYHGVDYRPPFQHQHQQQLQPHQQQSLPRSFPSSTSFPVSTSPSLQQKEIHHLIESSIGILTFQSKLIMKLKETFLRHFFHSIISPSSPPSSSSSTSSSANMITTERKEKEPQQQHHLPFSPLKQLQLILFLLSYLMNEISLEEELLKEMKEEKDLSHHRRERTGAEAAAATAKQRTDDKAVGDSADGGEDEYEVIYSPEIEDGVIGSFSFPPSTPIAAGAAATAVPGAASLYFLIDSLSSEIIRFIKSLDSAVSSSSSSSLLSLRYHLINKSIILILNYIGSFYEKKKDFEEETIVFYFRIIERINAILKSGNRSLKLEINNEMEEDLDEDEEEREEREKAISFFSEEELKAREKICELYGKLKKYDLCSSMLGKIKELLRLSSTSAASSSHSNSREEKEERYHKLWKSLKQNEAYSYYLEEKYEECEKVCNDYQKEVTSWKQTSDVGDDDMIENLLLLLSFRKEPATVVATATVNENAIAEEE